jgi:hypothetical protein
MNHSANTPSIDSEPPLAWRSLSSKAAFPAVTVCRYRRVGWLNALNICGRHYLTRAEIARFNLRAAAGEFAKEPARPNRRKENK